MIWIDGKKIYRRVGNYTTPATNSGQLFKLSDYNISQVTSLRGLLQYTETSIIPIPTTAYFSTPSDWGILYTFDGYLISNNGSGYQNKPLTVIIEYTKTT